jgi:hypothetical protein
MYYIGNISPTCVFGRLTDFYACISATRFQTKYEPIMWNKSRNFIYDAYENNYFIFIHAVLDVKPVTALQKVSTQLTALMFLHIVLNMYIYFTQRTSTAPDKSFCELLPTCECYYSISKNPSVLRNLTTKPHGLTTRLTDLEWIKNSFSKTTFVYARFQ